MKNTYKIVNARDGFTLIEVIIYLVLFSIIIGGTFTIGYRLLSGSGITSSNLRVQEEAHFILRKIDWVLSGLANVTLPASGTTGSILIVTRSGVTGPIKLDLNSGVLQITRGISASNALNSQSIPVTSVTFEHIPESGLRPKAVKVNFTIDGKTFETIRYVRN